MQSLIKKNIRSFCEKLYIRSSSQKINTRDFKNFFVPQKFKHNYNHENSLFKIRIGKNIKNIQKNPTIAPITKLTPVLETIQNSTSIYYTSNNINPKSRMPQINLNKKIDISKTLKFLKKLNKKANLKKNEIKLKDLIIKASHKTCLSINSFRNYYLKKDTIYFLKDFVIIYNNFSDEKIEKYELSEKKSFENYFENCENIKKSFFLIEDAGNFDLKTVKPLITLENNSALGVSKVFFEIKENDGFLEEKEFVNFSLSCDHRVIDGADGARWLEKFENLLKSPYKILI